MKAREQTAALINAYIELAQRHSYDDSQIIDALTDIFDEEELVDLGFGSFVEDYFHQENELKITEASALPVGYIWKDYDDGSGSLHEPAGETVFQYALHPIETPDGPEVEYRKENGPWHTFYGTLSEFKTFAEEIVNEKLSRSPLSTKIAAAQQKAASADMSAEWQKKGVPREA